MSERDDDSPTGPLNPRGDAGPDAAAPPGSPLRSDAPATGRQGSLGEDDAADGGGTGDGTGTPPEHPPTDPGPTGEIHARTQTEQVNEELQEENAGTALDQPSDASGGE